MKNKIAIFEGANTDYIEKVDALFANHIIELVIYDEVEKFPSFSDERFNYPFIERKNIINSFTIDDTSAVVDDYAYRSQKIEFQMSQVCLEANPFKQINFVESMYQAL